MIYICPPYRASESLPSTVATLLDVVFRQRQVLDADRFRRCGFWNTKSASILGFHPTAYFCHFLAARSPCHLYPSAVRKRRSHPAILSLWHFHLCHRPPY